MTVHLHTSGDCSGWTGPWLHVMPKAPPLPPANQIQRVGERLERVFSSIGESWWELARQVTAEPTGSLSVAGSCSPFASDLGLMMAWLGVVREFVQSDHDVLVVCDDPWLFRALALCDGVISGKPPALFPARIALALRGVLARLRVTLRVMYASMRFRPSSRAQRTGDAYVLVYGHPRSRPNHDAYFGDLLSQLRHVRRVVHTDDTSIVAGMLSDGRTESLHAFGSPWYAAAFLPFARWRIGRIDVSPAMRWLVERAASREGGGGSAAMTKWQIHCQTRFILQRMPSSLVWPWENHPWERALARTARSVGTRTSGYQHTDAGPHQFNMSPNASAGGLADLPDTIILNGPAYYSHFVRWGIPAHQLAIGGAFRMPVVAHRRYDPAGPIFVALSSVPEISCEMIEAVAAARRPGRCFVVKAHPMYPFDVPRMEGVEQTETPLAECSGVAALFYGTGSSGIEGMLAGIPTFRLLPSCRTGIETMPDGLRARAVTKETLDAALSTPGEPPATNPGDFFSVVDLAVWQTHLGQRDAAAGA